MNLTEKKGIKYERVWSIFFRPGLDYDVISRAPSPASAQVKLIFNGVSPHSEYTNFKQL